MNRTFYSYNFGCRVNQAEKERFDEELLRLGYKYSDDHPNIYVINSCSVTHKAEREARQLIYQIKRKSPETKIIVTGCAATNWIKQGIKVPDADYIIDNTNKEYVASLIEKNILQKEHEIKKDIPAKPLAHDKFINSGRVFIKIQDGCQRFCTYCIVPYLRGLPKSKSIERITEEIKSYEKHVKEACLVAINTEAFGYDTKEKFVDLINNVLHNTNIARLSFGSVHPWSVNDEFFDFYKKNKDNDRLVKFLHIPLQSGSNKMLQLMKRGYSREEFVEKLHTIHTINPMSFIGTDVIVGYLDETDKDFEDTYSFLEQTPIRKFHVFRFSKRNHTAAFYMSKRLNEPSAETKLKRAKALAELGKKKYEAFLQTHVGKTFSALLLEKREGEWQHGLLSNQIPVMVKTEKNFAGEIKKVKITAKKDDNLRAAII